MQDSTAPVVFDVRSLWRRLAALSDRRQRRGKRYALPLVLLLIVLAKLSGEDRPSGVADWVQHLRARLAEVLGLALARAPHHNTSRRLLAWAVAPADLDAAVSAFLRDLPQVGRSVLVSIDGKQLKGTIDAEDPHGAHLLVTYLPQKGIVLFQLPAGRKESEIRVAPALVEALDLRGKTVTAGALHTQRALSVQILAAGGEYLWRVKNNQPTLHAELAELFTADPRTVDGGQVRQDFRAARQVTKGHGRRESRRITVSTELNGYSDWPGLEQVFRLERERIVSKTGKHEREVAYGPSLTPRRHPRRAYSPAAGGRLFRRTAFAGQSFADGEASARATTVATRPLNARARPWLWNRPPPPRCHYRRRWVYLVSGTEH